MPKLTGPAVASAVLWIASLSLLLTGQAGAHPETYRLLLATAISSTVFAAIDHHRRELAEVAALSYRAGAASRRASPAE